MAMEAFATDSGVWNLNVAFQIGRSVLVYHYLYSHISQM